MYVYKGRIFMVLEISYYLGPKSLDPGNTFIENQHLSESDTSTVQFGKDFEVLALVFASGFCYH